MTETMTPETYPREPRLTHCPACLCDLLGWSPPITDRYGLHWELSKCGLCGLRFQVQPLTTEARRHFYGTGLYRQLCEQVTGKPWTRPEYLREQQRNYALNWLRKAHWFLPNGRWLDFGGSTGIVSEVWSWNDVTTTVADYGDGATTTPEEALAHGRLYDAVLCCQTFDHLPNPLQMARTFRVVTRPGGTLFVDVVKDGHTDYKLDHETYWPTVACFVGCLERAGWTIQWVDATTDEHHWAVGAVNV